jgi:transposase
MPRPYTQDLRLRVVAAVESGASRREASELYGLSLTVGVIWMQRWSKTGSIEATRPTLFSARRIRASATDIRACGSCWSSSSHRGRA